MRLVRYENASGDRHWGKAMDDHYARALVGGIFDDLRLRQNQDKVVRLLAPVDPPNIIAIGRNYRDHANEMGGEVEREPLVFLKATTAIIGPGEPIVLPKSAPDEVDYEGELGVVIGQVARNVSEANALHHVLGYTCANDVSARDCQKRRDKQWARGKSFDTFCPVGPVLVLKDSFDPSKALLRTRVNNTVMQEARLTEMLFSVPSLISYLSHQFTLLPGTLILTGTPAGVGAARNPPVFLRPGDEVSVEIDGIGLLRNSVVAAT